MGTLPVINLKGMSRMLYKFEWDKGIQSYAYEPKNQREADDIFLTQNKLYKTLRFSVYLGEDEDKAEEPCPKCEVVKPEEKAPEEEAPEKRKPGRPRKNVARLKKNLQAVAAA